MARCSKKKGIWVSKQCENAALTFCKNCRNPFCTEHLTVGTFDEFYCIDCLRYSIPSYAIEDFMEGEFENYIYYMASFSEHLKNLQDEAASQGIKMIPIEKLYNFTKYDALSFRQEYVQYYDDNDTSANLYDS